MLYFFQQMLNGVHAGALYALLAFGYALTHGVLRRTNLAFGALFASAGQVMILASVWGWGALWLEWRAAVPVGALVALTYAALVSHGLARFVFAPLATRAPNAVVVATLGVAMALMETVRIAADTRDVWLPPLLAVPMVFAEADGFRVTLTWAQLLNCAVAGSALLLLSLFLARSAFGRNWQAVSDDTFAASLCGIDTSRLFRRTFVLGGMVAALAGIQAGFYYGNIAFGSGLFFGLKILFLTAAGGYERPWRAASGAGAFGIVEALWTGYFPLEWREAWIFGGLALWLILVRAGRDEI
ncbi:MAG: branched-chain amino acid ABC transporter permease [Methylobacterium mesophilicum]|nr:branched-chain amino acid ABC transporter permease [Methylobacterium mesophilicum]